MSCKIYAPLNEVHTEFQAVTLQLIAAVEATSEEDLNQPQVWLKGHAIWPYIAGNTYEHFQEHGEIIGNWLSTR